MSWIISITSVANNYARYWYYCQLQYVKVMFFIGFIAAIIVGVTKLIALANGQTLRLVTESPYFYIALTMMIIGTQLFLTGFLAELVSRTSHDRNRYNISKEI